GTASNATTAVTATSATRGMRPRPRRVLQNLLRPSMTCVLGFRGGGPARRGLIDRCGPVLEARTPTSPGGVTRRRRPGGSQGAEREVRRLREGAGDRPGARLVRSARVLPLPHPDGPGAD